MKQIAWAKSERSIRLKLLLAVSLAFIAFALAMKLASPTKFLTVPHLGVWEWRDFRNVPKTELEKKFNFLSSQGFTDIYLDLSVALDILESRDISAKQIQITDLKDKLRQYIGLASQSRLKVNALSGAPEGANSSHRYLYSELLVNFIREYNYEVTESEKLVGLQLNIEPYSQVNYSDDMQTALQEYLDGVSEVVKSTRQDMSVLNFMVGFTMPFWFDGSSELSPLITMGTEQNYPAYHLIRLLSEYTNTYIVILAYRNKVNGSNGVVELVKDEFEYSNSLQVHVPIIVGQETTDVLPSNITYWGLGKASLYSNAKLIDDALKGYSNYGGLAVHDLAGFEEL